MVRAQADFFFMMLLFLGLWALVTIITVAEMMENTAKVKIIVFFVQSVPLVLGPQFRTSALLNLLYASLQNDFVASVLLCVCARVCL